MKTLRQGHVIAIPWNGSVENATKIINRLPSSYNGRRIGEDLFVSVPGLPTACHIPKGYYFVVNILWDPNFAFLDEKLYAQYYDDMDR